MAENHTLQIKELSKTYQGHPLLEGIDLQVSSGETLCLLGRSGSGKSTLLRIIAGLETPESGSLLWDGEDIRALPTHQRRFGLMFQDYALFPHLNVEENVAFGLRMLHLPAEQIRERSAQSLAQVNMSSFAKRRVTDLSGGEQQRVALARALAPQPRLLMLDEPLAALDRALRLQLQGELRQVLQQTGIPALYVTHDQEEALALGDRMALLHEGKIVQEGRPQELFRAPRSRWVGEFLGMTNFLQGTVMQVNPLVLDSVIGRLQATSDSQLLRPGDTVYTVITPVGNLLRTTAEKGNRLHGECISCQFKGDTYQIEVELKNQTSFSFFSEREFEIGENVEMYIPAGNIRCLVK
ncbi:MAG: ABC transporter ATP-binding protein [Anaerolineaceae bacterium]|nr:ABC transporter ATP-binding protein [Anaerolineaceae bacterium]